MGFITAMNKSVYAVPLNKTLTLSNECEKLLNILNKINDWITEVEPLKESYRFGNKAFSIFYNLLKTVRSFKNNYIITQIYFPFYY